ncbi:MAG: hypothetical protein ABMA13_24030 [Chthoniobacteraceae bacterium]
MQASRAILVAFLSLLFVFSTNRCAIAAAFPGEVEECCENERVPGDSERGLPCGGNECAPCATLESGVNLAALTPLAVPVPQAYEIAELMRRLAAAVVEEVSAAPPDPAAIPVPPWREGLKALPVRGPSLAA